MSRRGVGAASLLLAVGLAGSVVAQDTTSATLKGTVRDPSGNPISNARMTVAGTMTYTTTGRDGTYSMKMSAGVVNVRATYVGFKPLEIEGIRLKPGMVFTQDFTLSQAPPGTALVTSPPLTMDQVDEQVRALTGPSPKYPPELKAAGVSGTVMLRFIVAVNGTVEPASIQLVASTNTAFEAPAIDAIKAWKFEPAKVRGTAVRQLVQQAVKFAP